MLPPKAGKLGMYKSYEELLNHGPDFRIRYEFRTPEAGGRPTGTPYQGIRCNLSFPEESKNHQYMIWPEFEDGEGKIITDQFPVPYTGTARMWIADPKMRNEHCERIKINLRCQFREGMMVTAECTVIEILDLHKNPKARN